MIVSVVQPYPGPTISRFNLHTLGSQIVGYW